MCFAFGHACCCGSSYVLIVQTAVQQYGFSLEYAAPALKADRVREIVLAAVQQDGYATRVGEGELSYTRTRTNINN